MPSPISFTVAMTALPAGFTGTPAQLAAAIAARLTVTPAEPWNSFQNGGSAPVADIGPWLKTGREWYVWNGSAYVPATQDGSGLVAASVPLTAVADGTANGVLIYDGSGRPAVLAPGVTGRLLTMGASAPAWADPAARTCFEATMGGSDQSIDADGTTYTVRFDSVKHSNGVTYDTANYRCPTTAASVWFAYASLQIEDTGVASTAVQAQLNVRLGGVAQGGTLWNQTAINSRFGIFTAAVFVSAGVSYIDVGFSGDTAEDEVNGLAIAANSGNTRFGAIRLF